MNHSTILVNITNTGNPLGDWHASAGRLDRLLKDGTVTVLGHDKGRVTTAHVITGYEQIPTRTRTGRAYTRKRFTGARAVTVPDMTVDYGRAPVTYGRGV
jgi:hypothetical protein